MSLPILRWVSVKEIAQRYGDIYSWFCEDLRNGFFNPALIEFVPDGHEARLSVCQFCDRYCRVCNRPAFISRYLDPWHIYWLEYVRWCLYRRLPVLLTLHPDDPPPPAPVTVAPAAPESPVPQPQEVPDQPVVPDPAPSPVTEVTRPEPDPAPVARGGRKPLPSWFREQAPPNRPSSIGNLASTLHKRWSKLPEAERALLAPGCEINPKLNTVRNHLVRHYGRK